MHLYVPTTYCYLFVLLFSELSCGCDNVIHLYDVITPKDWEFYVRVCVGVSGCLLYECTEHQKIIDLLTLKELRMLPPSLTPIPAPTPQHHSSPGTQVMFYSI